MVNVTVEITSPLIDVLLKVVSGEILVSSARAEILASNVTITRAQTTIKRSLFINIPCALTTIIGVPTFEYNFISAANP